MTRLLALDPFAAMRRPRGRPARPYCTSNSDGAPVALPLRVAEEIMDRDGGSCRYCGFKPGIGREAHLDFHHLDHDHDNDAPDNLVVACRHCHAVHHAAYWGLDGRARLMYLPEINQASLSALFRAMAIADIPAMAGERGDRPSVFREWMRGGAAGVRAGLEERVEMAGRLLGTSDPSILNDHLWRLDDSPGIDARLAPYRIWLTLEGDDRTATNDVILGHGALESLARGGGPYAWLAGMP